MVRWSNGVAIRAGETKLLLDPLESDPVIPDIFITHAHYDHAKGFQLPVQRKHSTRETRELYEAYAGREVGNWEQIRVGRRLQLGAVEVEAHDAGHVLGSVQFEIITHDENLVYASHLNFTDTLLTKAAEVAPCDTLVLEAAFPTSSQTLPNRESVVAEIVKWALECIRDHRVPTLAAETIGLAQELIRVFNTWTELPVIVHNQIAQVSQVYAKNGVGLHCQNAGTAEASSLIEEARCVAIIPRRFDTTRFGEFRVAYVTDSPTRVERDAGRIFALSDQADLDQLLSFVREARPKTVLTVRGGAKVLAELVSKRLGIPGQVLYADVRSRPARPIVDEEMVGKCEEYLLGLVQEANLTYERQALIARALSEGFKLELIEEALNRLSRNKSLTYSGVTDGYSLP